MTAATASQAPPVVADGVAQCARYALGPNRLHLCGPDMNQEVLAYLHNDTTDLGLNGILQGFRTLYPYLQQIAQANHLPDPFDPRVVEAYWLGNNLLDTIPPKNFYRHITDNLQLNKKTPVKPFARLKGKLSQGALMHHSFHVLNIWHQTDHQEQNLSDLDKCRISWAQVTKVNGPALSISRQPLILTANQLALGPCRQEKIYRRLEASTILDNVQPGDFITIHWDIPCEIITSQQLFNLKKYTSLSIHFANQTI